MTPPDQSGAATGRRHDHGRDALVLALLLVVAALRYLPALSASTPLGDEQAYLEAMHLARQGRSPYEHARYVYPPTLARVGGWLLGGVGDRGVELLLRGLNLVGAVLLVGTALRLTGWRRAAQAAAGVLVIVLAPPVSGAIQLGNLSALVAGATVLGLVAWPRHPAASGGLLAAAIVLKPVMAPALLVLLGHRPAQRTRRHLLAGGLALLLATLAMCPWPADLAAMVRNARATPLAESSVALPRVLGSFGLPVPDWATFLAVTLVGIVVARRRPRTAAGVAIAGGAAAVLASPLVWCHTFAVALPTLTIALAAALERVVRPGAAGGAARRRAILTLLGVCLAAIPLLTSDLWTLGDWPRGLQGALGAVPPLALAILAWHALGLVAPAGDAAPPPVAPSPATRSAAPDSGDRAPSSRSHPPGW